MTVSAKAPHRVLLVAPRFHTNQVPVIQALREAGHEVAFFALRQGYTEWHEILQPHIFGRSGLTKLAYRVVRPQNLFRFDQRYALPEIGRFLKAFHTFRPTVVIIRNPDTAFGFLALFASLSLRSHPILYVQRPKYSSPAWRLWSQRVSNAPVITPVLGDMDKCPIANRNTYYVPFVMHAATAPEHKQWFSDGFINIITIAKFYKRKNHNLLLDSLARVEFDFRLTIIGECQNEEQKKVYYEMINYLEAKHLIDRTQVLTNLSYVQVQALYPQHDLFVLPSSNEPAAVSPLEAMAHGLPVICSDTSGTRCYIVDDYNGAIFKTGDVEDLSNKILRLVCDRDRLVTMGRRSYALVAHRHRPAYYVNAIQRLAQGLPVEESVFLSLPEE